MERAFAENHRTGEKLLACSGFESDNPNDRNTELDSKKPRHTFARAHSFAYSCSRNNCAIARERKNPMLKLHVLASGSKGNAAIAENAKTGTGVLIDCGICKRDFLERCDQAGFDPTGIEAVFITHEHGDHTKGLGVVLRGLAKIGCAPTIFANRACIDASSTLQKIADDFDISPLALGRGSIEAAGLNVLPFATSHDAAASFGFRIEASDGDAAIPTSLKGESPRNSAIYRTRRPPRSLPPLLRNLAMRGFAHPKPLSPCTSRKTTTTTTCRERRLKKDSLSPTATRASYAAIKDASRV